MKINYLKLFFILITVITSCAEKEILSHEEKEWLSKDPNIKMSLYGYVPPYLFNNNEGVPDGIFIDFVNTIEQKINYSFKKVNYDNWPELYTDATSGKIDIILDIPETKKRSEIFDFYSGFLKSNYVIITTKNKKITYKNLSNYSIVLPEDYAIVETLQTNFSDININILPEERSCLLAVSNGSYDAYLAPKLIANYFIHDLNLKNLVISDKTPFNYEPKIAVTKTKPELSKIVSKAIESITFKEKKQIMNNWLYDRIQPYYMQLHFWIITIGLLFTIIIVFILSNVILNKKVKKRTLLLHKALDKAYENKEIKNRFIQNISHEIRTPMNSILGFSELLSKEGITKEELLSYTQHINSSGKKLVNIIDSILDVSNLETSENQLNYQEITLSLILEGLDKTYRNVAEDKNIELNFYTQITPDDQFLIDKNAIQKIYNNLIDNALKFTNEGSVEVHTQYINKNLIVKIKDTGIGIDELHKKAIFEIFSLHDLSNTNTIKGLGIGLAIVKKKVTSMNGDITFISKPTKGTCFKVTLPIAKVTPKPNINTTDTNIIKCTVLVAEDAKVNFLLVKSVLKQLKGYDITILHAENGKIAVDMFNRYSKIDLVIMDINMPVMDGYEASRIIKSKNPKQIIVAHTAYTNNEDIKEALSVGCETVLAKPIEMQLFKSTIISYLKSTYN